MRLLIFTLLFSGLLHAQDTILIESTMTTYKVVVEDNMINYPFGKDFPGKITTVYPTAIFLDTDIVNESRFYNNHRRPIGSHPQEVPQLWYYDGGGTVHTVLANEGVVYIPTSDTSFWAQWHWRRLGVEGHEVPFGPVFFKENN